MKTQRHGIYHQPLSLMNLTGLFNCYRWHSQMLTVIDAHHEEDPASQLGAPSGISDQGRYRKSTWAFLVLTCPVILVNQSSAIPPQQTHLNPTPSTGDSLEKIIESTLIHVAGETIFLEERPASVPSLVNSLDFTLGATRAASLTRGTTSLGQDYEIASQASPWGLQPSESAKIDSDPIPYIDQGQQQWHPNSQVQTSTQVPSSFSPVSHQQVYTNCPRMGIPPVSTESSTTFQTSELSVPTPNRLVKSYTTVSTLNHLEINSSTISGMPSNLLIPNYTARNSYALLEPYPTSTMMHSQHAPPTDYNTITRPQSTFKLQMNLAARSHRENGEFSSFTLPNNQYPSNLSPYVQQSASSASFRINSDDELPQYTYTGSHLSTPEWWFDDERMLWSGQGCHWRYVFLHFQIFCTLLSTFSIFKRSRFQVYLLRHRWSKSSANAF
jgi:hypothetical protein